MDKKLSTLLMNTCVVSAATFVLLSMAAVRECPDSRYENAPEEQNPIEGRSVIFVRNEADRVNADGIRGHLEAISFSSPTKGLYENYVKRAIDIALSFGGLVVLSPIYAAIALAIKIDDPGPVLFTQKRVGKNKQYFKLHKFRSMKMSTPHDIPTHMLGNPDQYITRVGKFLRAHSLDEIPQIWDIFIGNMSLIGPRPALWNQDVLIAERDRYGANDIRPGLTGWAQINGRDELELTDKARYDGEYAEVARVGGFRALCLDCKCFFGTIRAVISRDGIIEGGTGEVKRQAK